MDSRDPKCVHIDDNLAKANIIASWLTGEGIPAQVMNEMTLGGFEGLVSVIPKLGFRGAEVWVDNIADVDRARGLLVARNAELQAKHAADENVLVLVEALCEECKGRSTFPGAQRGTVQSCPNCGAFIDVPGDQVPSDDDYEFDSEEVAE